MEFTVEFYETETGKCPVREFLDELKGSDPADARLAKQGATMKRTNFDRYLKKQMTDPEFARRFKRAGETWDVAMQLAALRQQAGLSQRELARRVKTSQQQISRLESPRYEGHSLSMLRRVARELRARVRVVIEPEETAAASRVAEVPAIYRAKRPRATRS